MGNPSKSAAARKATVAEHRPERVEATDRLAKVVIEEVTPQIDCARYPVKRIVGETCHVGADIYKDGHDRLAARILARGPGDRAWHHHPMTYHYDDDRWAGAFLPDRIGLWQFTIEAWPDHFETWRHELQKWLDGGTEADVASELLHGSQIVTAAASRAAGEARAKLTAAARGLGDPNVDARERAELGLSPDLQGLMAAHFDPREITRHYPILRTIVDRERARFGAWYEMFPRSQSKVRGKHGTFRDAARALTRIADLGFDVVYLAPIHPIGHTNRKGPNNKLVAGPDDPGSPWAIGSEAGGHTAVEPKLGTLDDFDHFVETARKLDLEVALDYALQCSPDHPWVKEHPDWFFVRPDGTIKYAENPPKKYEDIYPLNLWCEDREGLWNACKEIFYFWIDHGVKIFRVDNPHTKPLAFWEWVISDIREKYPEVIFLSEAFTRPKRMMGLAKLGFTQSYTYFTWRNAAHELREYVAELTRTEIVEYFRANFFANTPDILHEYLQSGGRPAFRIRLLLAATLSSNYGIYSGFELCENVPREPGSEEYLNSEKYEVRVRDWNAPGNINEDIARINRARHEYRALQLYDNITFHDSENDQVLFYRKYAAEDDLLIVVNVDPHNVQEAHLHVPLRELGIGPDEEYRVEDLLTGERYTWHGARNYVRLDPRDRVGHVLRVVGASARSGP